MTHRHTWTTLPAVVLAAALLATTGCEQKPSAGPAVATPEHEKLVILTPHSDLIRETFDRAFSAWHEKKYTKGVLIEWKYMPTRIAETYIEERYDLAGGPRGGGIGVDLFFGGGLPTHQKIIDDGYSEPVEIDKDVLAGIPAEFRGQRLYDDQGRWYGSALTGFGILYNRTACKQRGIPEPTSWDDLAKPDYYGWLCIADPTRSGSTVTILSLILQQHGWQDGWTQITQLLGNCRVLVEGSGQVPALVKSGQCLAGLTVEFTAKLEMQKSGGGNLAYVNASTAITPDPIMVLRAGPNLTVAKRFVEFVLSQEGQALWALPPGTPGGPLDEALHRLPIRPDVYEKYGDQLVVKENPFTTPEQVKIDPKAEAMHSRVIPPLVLAACGENHVLLQRAWKKVADAGAADRDVAGLTAPVLREVDAAKVAEEIAQNRRASDVYRQAWSDEYRDRFETIVGPPPAVARKPAPSATAAVAAP